MTPIVSIIIAMATYATGSSGNAAMPTCSNAAGLDGSRVRRAAHAIQDPAIATRQSSGNDTTMAAFIHAIGLFIEPGASKNIADSAAPTNPGMSSRPHTADA